MDEAFGFTVGARAIGSCAQVTESESSAGGGEAVGDVARAVVGHDAGDRDAVAGVPGDQSSKEGDRGWRPFVSEDFGVSQTGGVIDGNVDELPAGPRSALSAVAGDAVADDFDAAQLLGVNVDELSGLVSLVAVNGLLRVEVGQPRQAFSRQDAGHRGRARADSRSNLEPGVPASAQSEDLLDHGRVSLTRRAMGSRCAIDQRRLAGLPIPTVPFRSGSAGNAGCLGGAGQGDPPLDPLDHQHSSTRSVESSI